MNKNENLHNTLSEFGVKVTEKMRGNVLLFGFAGNQQNRRINSSGGLADSFYFTISTDLTNGQMSISFWSEEDYAMIVHDGRSPGKFPPPDAMRKFIDEKPLRLRKTVINKFGQKINMFVPKTEENIRQAAFLIGRKIAEEGTVGRPFATRAIEELWPKVIQPIGISIARDIQAIIIDDFRKKNYKIAKEQRWQNRPIY